MILFSGYGLPSWTQATPSQKNQNKAK